MSEKKSLNELLKHLVSLPTPEPGEVAPTEEKVTAVQELLSQIKELPLAEQAKIISPIMLSLLVYVDPAARHTAIFYLLFDYSTAIGVGDVMELITTLTEATMKIDPIVKESVDELDSCKTCRGCSKDEDPSDNGGNSNLN